MKFYAVTHDILGDVFWDVFRNGLLDAALRYEVDVEHLRPGRFSPEVMAQQLEAAAGARPQGIISTVPDVSAVDGPLRGAIAAGIPVICVNARDPRPAAERIPYLFYIGGDDVVAGELAARYLVEKVKPRTALCVDHYMFEHACHRDRWAGFEKAMVESGIAAERLRVPGEDARAATDQVGGYLETHPDCDAVVTLGPPGASVVVAASSRGPAHVTFDVAALQLEGIRSGRILATIDSQQYLQGYLGVELMWLHVARGFTLASDLLTGPALIDLGGIERAAEGVARGWR